MSENRWKKRRLVEALVSSFQEPCSLGIGPETVDLRSEIVKRFSPWPMGLDSKRPAKASTASRALRRHFVIQPPITSFFDGLSAVST